MRELDLHGLAVDDALKTFVEFYNRSIKTYPKEAIRVVHGYGSSGGSGKIRLKLREFLAGAADSLDWETGEDAEGNLGVTVVRPRKALFAREQQLAGAILEFCTTPRTESKIAGEFRNYAPREIKQTIRSLLRQSQLKEILKGSTAVYIARRS